MLNVLVGLEHVEGWGRTCRQPAACCTQLGGGPAAVRAPSITHAMLTTTSMSDAARGGAPEAGQHAVLREVLDAMCQHPQSAGVLLDTPRLRTREHARLPCKRAIGNASALLMPSSTTQAPAYAAVGAELGPTGRGA